MNRSGLHHVFAYGPKTDPTFLRFFCVVICWGAGCGVGGVITSCVYVIIDFLWRTHFMLRCTLKVLGGGWGGGNNVLCLRDHRFSSVNTLNVTVQTSVLGGGWGGGVQLHPVSTSSSIFFGEHTSCYLVYVITRMF